MSDFAKLYRADDVGQVLVTLYAGEAGNPQIQLRFNPEGFGISSVISGFPKSPEGWDLAQKVFDVMTEDSALEIVRRAFYSDEAPVDLRL